MVTDTIWLSLDVFGYPQIGSDTSRFSSWIPPVSHQLNERGALSTSFSNKRNITSSSCNSSTSSCKICSSSSSSDNLNERGALATRWQTVFHKSRPREGKLCGFVSSSSIVVAAVAESRRVGLGRASYIASSSIYSICSSCSNVEQKNKPGGGQAICNGCFWSRRIITGFFLLLNVGSSFCNLWVAGCRKQLPLLTYSFVDWLRASTEHQVGFQDH